MKIPSIELGNISRFRAEQMGAAMLIVISQLIVAYIIELLGWFGVEKEPFTWQKVLGMAVAILGIVIFKWEK